ncbi:unnamed protein product, partial [Rangifer tarandus platyrhynchus]
IPGGGNGNPLQYSCQAVGNQIVVRGYAVDLWKQVQRHNPMEESIISIFNKVPRALAMMWSGTGIKGTDRHCAAGDSVQLH